MFPPSTLKLVVALLGASALSPPGNTGFPIRGCEARSTIIPTDLLRSTPSPPSPSVSAPTPYRRYAAHSDYHTLISATSESPVNNAFHDDDAILFPNANPKTGCTFLARGRTYNICPLLSIEKAIKVDHDMVANGHGHQNGRIEWEEDVARWGPTGEYQVTLGGTSRSKLCPDGTWVCLIKRDGLQRASTTVIAGSSRDGTSEMYAQNFAQDGREFDLWLVSEDAAARIVLVCSGIENLEHHSSLAGLHIFRWHTRHACPITADGDFSVAEEESEPEPSDGESKKNEELVDAELPVGGVARKWLGVIVLLGGGMMILTSILISSPGARQYALKLSQSARYSIVTLVPYLKRFTRTANKHFPHFRAGEGRLVHWAQEDMTLDGDEDFMVNGSGNQHGWDDLSTLDEYVPLKTAPAAVRSFQSTGGSPSGSVRWSYSTYGSVPFEGFDIDESEVAMGGPAADDSIRTWFHTKSVRVKRLLWR